MSLMHEIAALGEVTRIRFWSRIGAVVGYDVSVFVTRGVFVDTGFPGAAGEIAALARQLAPRGAFVTHWHEDHAGNVATLAALGIPIAAAPDTLARLSEDPPMRLYRRAVWGRPACLSVPVEPFTDRAFRMIATPGHTTDHHVVWDAERGTLFTGDLWLGVRARVMHESESPRRIVESLRLAAALEPARMFDAHRGEVTGPRRALTARIDYLEATIGAISERIAQGWPDGAIVRGVLNGDELVAIASRGEYSRRNFVRAVRREVEAGAHR